MSILRVIQLKTEYLINPVGIELQQPRLYWSVQSDLRDASQSAYQVLVASSRDKLDADEGDLWDSGRVNSSASTHIVYEGQALASEDQAFWKVRVWNQQDQSSVWSETATWTMGLLGRDKWQGRWIGKRNGVVPDHGTSKPILYLRRDFQLDKAVKRATVYATALGIYELHIDGTRIGENRLAPEWTDYNMRTQYQTFDVTEQLSAGEHAFGVILGPGWYAGFIGMFGFQKYGQDPSFLLQLNVEYEDGSKTSVYTDKQWTYSHGPLISADIQMGELYDARLEMPGWDQPQGPADQDAFQPVEQMHDYKGKLSPQMAPAIKVMEQLVPIAVTQPNEQTLIYNFGQNMGGWVRLNVSGQAGTQIQLRFGEMLDETGNLYTDNLRHARQTDVFILNGANQETYEPTFAYHGFQYAEISGDLSAFSVTDITALVAYSSMTQTGWLETSDALVNRLVSNILWSQRGNFVSVPTDCPQRDERHGWTGDAQVFCRTASYNMDTAMFFHKWIRDLRDSQRVTGAYPDFAPFIPGPKGDHNNDFTYTHTASAGWGDAGVIIPWMMYEVYGDTKLLEDHYDSMAQWVDFLDEMFPNGVRSDFPQYGDWLSVPHEFFGEEAPQYEGNVSLNSTTPYDVFGSAYYAHSVNLLSKIAKVLGRSEDHARLQARFEEVRAVFQATFIAADGTIKGKTQSIYAMALEMDLVQPELRQQVVAHIVADIEKRGGRLTTGFHGIRCLMPALCENGYEEVALGLLHQEQYPSWKFPVLQGATSIWERWDGWTPEKGFQRAGMNSFNHYSLGSVGEWLYRYIGGIDLAENHYGFQHFLLRPLVGRGLSYANCRYDSHYGTIISHWKLDGDKLTYEVEVPANCTAVVHLPAAVGSSVTESGQDLAQATGIRSSKVTDKGVEIEIGSGTYSFSCDSRYTA